ncbi:VOC family protein [Kitasatospora sp. NBC_01250]|uniref:VOC family protein n=1 Tax=unclassified Kitasatospora TaxID=2633591 RepID=UPI002E163087|nr:MULTISPECIES: VOC family protein [unclassified Kitasatospora]WSJ67851.1 VOC family protein [Kitasatospora sp. NBC_01302]
MSAGQPLALRGLSACLSVADLAASVSWYGEVLGFTPIRGLALPQFDAEVVYLGNGTQVLELMRVANGIELRRPPPPNHGALHGVSQLAFYVTDLARTAAELRARGAAPVTEVADVPELGVKALFVQDPEGHYLEFIQADWL